MTGRRILIVDDDKDLTLIISELLKSYGYEVATAENREQAIQKLTESSFHLVLLDINLPDALGYEVCKELRRFTDVPVLFASARTSEDDRIAGFDIGGDDYISKPYSMKELLARVNALMRRAYGQNQQNQEYSFGDIVVSPDRRSVKKKGQEAPLSLREYDLLLCLCQNKNKVMEKEKLLSLVWGAFSMVEPSTLTVHMRWLREKLEDDPAKPKYLKTVWGKGYALFCDEETIEGD